MRKAVLAGAAAGATMLGAAVIYYFREKATSGPNYRVLASEGDLEIRDYPPIIVAETVVRGPRQAALAKVSVSSLTTFLPSRGAAKHSR